MHWLRDELKNYTKERNNIIKYGNRAYIELKRERISIKMEYIDIFNTVWLAKGVSNCHNYLLIVVCTVTQC